MANNRLYLRCKRTGEKVMLAKYYPSTGWHVTNNELKPELDAMFHRDDFGENNKQRSRKGYIETAIGGMWDAGAHELEYEQD